jgi:type I restriction enzyme S subunit
VRYVSFTLRTWKQYPEYKDSKIEWLGKIPAHWEAERLKAIASVTLSNVDKKSQEGHERVRLCNYVDVYKNDRVTSDMDYMVATATAEQIRRFSLRMGDVLITKDSESWDDIAVPAVVDENMEDVVCGYHLALIRPVTSKTDGNFLARAFSSIGLRDQFWVAANGITRFGLTGDAIRAAWFPVPPYDEQQAIADFLDRETAKIDALVEKKEQLIELLQEKRIALITHAVTKGLPAAAAAQAGLDPNVPLKDSGIEWLGQIPVHWEIRRLKNVVDLRNEKVFSIDSGKPYIGMENVEPWIGKFLDTDLEVTGVADTFEAGDVLFGKLRPYLAKAILASMSGQCSSEFLVMKPKAVSSRFLHLLVLSDGFVRTVDSATYGTKMPRANWETVGGIGLAIPEISEQRAIADFLDHETAKIDALIAKIQEAIEWLKEYRIALISAAVTGKIDVRCPVKSGGMGSEGHDPGLSMRG